MTDTRNPAAAAAPGYEDMLFAADAVLGHTPEKFSEADRRDIEMFFQLVQQRKAQRNK